MSSDITNALIDFFAFSDHNHNTLATALLEPLKRQQHFQQYHKESEMASKSEGKITPCEEKESKNSKLAEIEQKIDNAFSPMETIIEDLASRGFGSTAVQISCKIEEIEKSVKKLFGEVIEELDEIKDTKSKDSSDIGEKAFLRDHHLLPELIVHPKMTLRKLLTVYPDLPCPQDFNQNLLLKENISVWLPILSDYSQQYTGRNIDTEDSREIEMEIRNMVRRMFKVTGKLKKDHPKNSLDKKDRPNHSSDKKDQI